VIAPGCAVIHGAAPRGARDLGWRVISLFFFNDTATTEIYTLSLHDALPISCASAPTSPSRDFASWCRAPSSPDRKSTRLNSSHITISYAVFCFKQQTAT